VWYPSPLAKATDVTHIFLMLLAIDIILGPILGFIIYKENKKTLQFDLAVIFLLQLFALGYGLFSISQARPVWIAYNVDRFELIRVNDIIADKIENAYPEYQTASWLKPKFVGVQISESIEEKNQNMFEEVLGGISIAQRPERYVSVDQVETQMKLRSQSLRQLNQYNTSNDLEEILTQYPNAHAWLPLKGNAVDMVVLINKEKAEVIKIVDLRPW